MANKDDYLIQYRQFFEEFANTVEPNDQLPVKLGSYKFINSEVVGGIVDWCMQYLNRKSCPSTLVGPLINTTIAEIRIVCKKNPLSCGFNPIENVYEPLKLMQTVMSKLNEICFRYLDNSQLDNLPIPPTLSIPSVSVCSTRNTRRRMEDRHVVIHDINTMFNIQDSSPSSYYAVFDGHAGSDAASYSAAHLHQFLVESKFYPTDPERALKEAFMRTDELFLEKSKIENFRSGTTAVCALLRPKEEILYVAWVGDSQALLVNRGKVLQIVKPHKPSREDEKERIESNGGCVMFWGMWRVNGQLAVSRAIGDIKMKPYVTAEPDIVTVPLDGNEEFLIIACDGLWDFVSEDDAAIAVYNRIKENSENVDSVAEHLVHLAKQEGSRDNISVIVIFLKDPSKSAKKFSSNWGWAVKTGAIMDASSNSNSDFDLLSKQTVILDHTNDYQRNVAPRDTQDTDIYIGDRNKIVYAVDLGPETNIDNIDDIIPVSISNDNITDDAVDFSIIKQQTIELDTVNINREEYRTPQTTSVLDSSGLADNVADSGDESEDEWNYYRVDSKQRKNILLTGTDTTVSLEQSTLDSEEMSQLNPDAKEFVPVSPTRSTASPSFNRDVMEDTLISQSPRRAVPMDISVPSSVEFQHEVKQRPSEVFDECNEKLNDENNHQLTSQEIMQNLLNGKDASEIEFRPMKTSGNDHEPDFTITEINNFEIKSALDISPPHEILNLSQCEFVAKKQDPMSISFYEDKNEMGTKFSTNPFDLNKVQMLPDEIVGNIEDTYNLNKDVLDSEVQLKDEVTDLKLLSSNEDNNGMIDMLGSGDTRQEKGSISSELDLTNKMSPSDNDSRMLKSPCEQKSNGAFSTTEYSNNPFTTSNMDIDITETSKSPILDAHYSMELCSPSGPLSPKSPNPELTGLVSPDITASIKDEHISGDISDSTSPLNQLSPVGTSFDDILKSPIQELKNDIPHDKSSANINVDIERIFSPEITNSPISSLDQPLECHRALNVEAGLSERSISLETLDDAKENIDLVKELVVDNILNSLVDSNFIDVINKPSLNILDSTGCDKMKDETNVVDTNLIPGPVNPAESTNNSVFPEIDLICEMRDDSINTRTQINEDTVGNEENITDIVREINLNTEMTDIINTEHENSNETLGNIKTEVIDVDIKSPVFLDVNEIVSEEQENRSKDNEVEGTISKEHIKESDIDSNTNSVNLNISVVESSLGQSEIISFLERSVLPDATSPLSSSEEPGQLHDHPELWKCVYPLPQQTPLDIKCDPINPEFQIRTVASPTEEIEIKETSVLTTEVVHENELSISQSQDTVEKAIESKIIPEKNKDTTCNRTVAAKTGSITNTAKPKPKENISTKKPMSTKPKSSTPTQPLSAVRKTIPSTTIGGVARLTATKAPIAKPKSAKPASLPKTSTSCKPIQTSLPLGKSASEQKPLTNLDVRVPIKQLLVKKPSSSTTTSKLSATSSPTKTATGRQLSATAPKPSEKSTRLNPIRPTSVNIATTKSRPTSLMPKSSISTTVSAKASTARTTTTTTTTLNATKPTTRPAAPRPRSVLPTTRTTTKAADTEKKIKEASNKQLSASRTTAIKKIDNKGATGVKLGSRTTTSKASMGEKPLTELNRTTVTKTRVTSTNSSLNHSGTVNVIQEITTVNVVHNDVPQLAKDNSPTNAAPVTDNSNLVDTAVPISD